MVSNGLGTALRIQSALINAGVPRDLCWTQEDGSVTVHDEQRERIDISVGRNGTGFGYAAADMETAETLIAGKPLTTVAKRVAELARA